MGDNREQIPDSDNSGNTVLNLPESVTGDTLENLDRNIGNKAKPDTPIVKKPWGTNVAFIIGAILVPLLAAIIGGIIQNPEIITLLFPVATETLFSVTPTVTPTLIPTNTLPPTATFTLTPTLTYTPSPTPIPTISATVVNEKQISGSIAPDVFCDNTRYGVIVYARVGAPIVSDWDIQPTPKSVTNCTWLGDVGLGGWDELVVALVDLGEKQDKQFDERLYGTVCPPDAIQNNPNVLGYTCIK